MGYLHSDVKPNNIVLDQKTKIEDLLMTDKDGTLKVQENFKLFLLDFGLSETYINTDGCHVAPRKIDRQLGNKFFMSLSQL